MKPQPQHRATTTPPHDMRTRLACLSIVIARDAAASSVRYDAPELLLCLDVDVAGHSDDGIPWLHRRFPYHVNAGLARHANVQQHNVHVSATGDELRCLGACTGRHTGAKQAQPLAAQSLLPAPHTPPRVSEPVQLTYHPK